MPIEEGRGAASERWPSPFDHPDRTRRQTPEITSAGIICATRMVLSALGVVMVRTHAVPGSGI
jgi:hypothetical protein